METNENNKISWSEWKQRKNAYAPFKNLSNCIKIYQETKDQEINNIQEN